MAVKLHNLLGGSQGAAIGLERAEVSTALPPHPEYTLQADSELTILAADSDSYVMMLGPELLTLFLDQEQREEEASQETTELQVH